MSLEPFEYFQIDLVCALWFRHKFLDLLDLGKDTLNVAPVVKHCDVDLHVVNKIKKTM